MALSTTISATATPTTPTTSASATTTHALPQQHWSFATPRSHGYCEESSHNPHHFMPRAPTRRRELSTTSTSFTTPKESGFLRISNQNTIKKKPLSNRLFFPNLDSRNDHFRPLLPSSTSAFKSRHDKYIVRRIIPTILLASRNVTITASTSTTNNSNKKKKLVSSSSSSSSEQQQQHPSLICVPWIKRRSRRGGLLRAERRE